MFYGRIMIALIYVDDVLLSVPDQDKIDEVTKELEDDGILFTLEEDAYYFLAVKVDTDK